MKALLAGFVVALLAGGGAIASADGQCRRGGAGPMGMGGGPGMPAGHQGDMQVFHYLLANRDKIRRTVTETPDGIVTVTESDDPEVVARLTGHVRSMLARVEDGRPIHARDPLFAELFRNAHHIKASYEPLPNGVRVTETSDDAYTVRLLKEHARVVGLFIEHGMSEMHRDHPAPPR
jgi:hypothetical protein